VATVEAASTDSFHVEMLGKWTVNVFSFFWSMEGTSNKRACNKQTTQHKASIASLVYPFEVGQQQPKATAFSLGY